MSVYQVDLDTTTVAAVSDVYALGNTRRLIPFKKDYLSREAQSPCNPLLGNLLIVLYAPRACYSI